MTEPPGGLSVAPDQASVSAAEPASPPAARGIAAAAGLITAGNLTSRLLGLVREQVIAGLFGKTIATSAFATAATVPQMLYDLVIGGAVSAALIPVLSEYASRADEEGRAELGRVAGTIGFVVLLTLTAATALLVLFAPWLVWVLGVAPDSPAYNQTITYVRIVLPSVVLLGLSSVVTALLYSRQEFIYPAFAVALYNVGIIVAAVFFAGAIGATSLVLGVLLGAALQLALQVVGLRAVGLRLAVDLRHPALRRILRLYAPVAFGLVVSQVGVVIDRNLAWRTGEDSIAVMRFATTLIQLPLGLIATATSFAVLPRLSRFAAAPDGLRDYKQTLALGIRLAVLAIVPALVMIVAFREPLVKLLFERGAFDAVATRMTAAAVLYYAPQLPFVAVDQLLIFAFYARKNTVTPAIVGLVGVGIYLASGMLLIGPGQMGVFGLVIANTIQNSLHAVILFALLYRAVGTLAGHGAGVASLKAAAAAMPLAAASWLIVRYLPTDRGTLWLFVGLLGGLALAGVVYIGALAALRTDELGEAVAVLRRRLRRG